MKKSYKIISLVIVLMFSMVMFAGCGSSTDTDTPTGALDGYFKAVKADDKDAMQELYAGKVTSSLGESLVKDDNSGLPEEVKKSILEKILDFDYELSNEKIDGDKATVDAKITTYNMGTAMENFMKSYMEKAMKVASEDPKNAEKKIEEMAGEIFNEELQKIEKKDYSKDVTLGLEKKDGKWVVSEFDEKSGIADALLGGLFEKLKELGIS